MFLDVRYWALRPGSESRISFPVSGNNILIVLKLTFNRFPNEYSGEHSVFASTIFMFL